MSKGKVLIAAPVHPVLSDGLLESGYELVYNLDIKRKEALDSISEYSGIITSTRLQLDRELLDNAVQLKWIGRMGSGMEVIDVPYATAKSIFCCSSPEGNRNAVAEHALGMLLSLIRNIGNSQQEIVNGKWLREENRGTELEGKTIGIIGFGNTGSSFAKKLQGFDMNILAYDIDPRIKMPGYVQQCVDLQRIYNEATIVSFHLPITPLTFHYVNDKFLSKMSQRFVLINSSRGEVVQTTVLKDGLDSGKLIGACLDVWEQEPIEKMDHEKRSILDELLKLHNVIVTPHIAGYTYEALYKMSKVLLNKLNENN